MNSPQFQRFIFAVALLIAPFFAHAGDVDTKVVYGPDDRQDVYEITNEMIRSLANSTCILTFNSTLTPAANDTFTANFSPYTISGLDPCPGEPFGSQPTLGFCSGFLVGTDLIATAGHCLIGNITDTSFVFGFDMLDASTPVGTFDSSQVYTGVEVVGRVLAGGEDWMLVRVDRDVTAPGAVVLPIRREGSPALSESVGVIGHPSGLPKKVAFGATTEVKDLSSPIFFEANLDTYGGNSGSPVFNQNTLIVEGILVRGQTDFINGGGCFESNMLSDVNGDNDNDFEDCTRMTVLQDMIPIDGEPIMGDVDMNGMVNSSDIQNVINEVLTGLTGLDTDLNGDNVTNSIDIQTVINIVLGI